MIAVADSMPSHAGGLEAVFSGLAASLDERHDVVDALDLLVEAAVRFTPAVEAGIVLADTLGVLHVVASTSERASDVEETQLGTRQGPCWDSFQTGHVTEISNISQVRHRWPDFVYAAENRNFAACYAMPLTIRGDHLGAMNLFFDRQITLSDSDVAVMQGFAQFATIGIVQGRTLREHADRADQLQQALDSRVVIEQAKGALAYQRGVSLDDAFKLLRSRARSTQSRIGDVAAQVIDRLASP